MKVSLRSLTLLIALVALPLLGCSTLKDIGTGAVKGAMGGDKGGIELDTQLGDRETETNLQTAGARGTGDVSAKDNAKVNVKSESAGTKFNKATGVNIKNENVPLWVVLLLILGWVLPDPVKMWNQSFGKLWRKS